MPALIPDAASNAEARATRSSTVFLDGARSRRTLLALALLAGVIVRIVPVAAHDFPLNDGGMFYQMALEIRQAGYALPAFTQYNADNIPFAYAPLGLYLAALAGQTPDGILAAVRWIPVVVACLMLPAFALLARALLRDERTVIASTFAFALLPRAYLWMMGGGLTRSLGMLFTILALWQAHRLFRGAPAA